MTLQDLQTLLDYHYWARDRLLEAIDPLTQEQFNKAMGSSFTSIRETVVHVYAAEVAWYSRWQGVSPSALMTSESLPDVASIRSAWAEQEKNMRRFIESLGESGVGKVFDYKNLMQQPNTAPFWQMLQHVVNHASYHRGQVTTMLRQMSAAAGKSMDMIAFYRTRG
jgi:uncharacterized damage-inducible protein DinB